MLEGYPVELVNLPFFVYISSHVPVGITYLLIKSLKPDSNNRVQIERSCCCHGLL